MIPGNTFAQTYASLFGENTLLAMAQNNLLNNLDRIRKVRTYTFLSNNGQTKYGVSHNDGLRRSYSWQDTVIDCRNAPSLTQSYLLADFEEALADHPRFKLFKDSVQARSEGILYAVPFYMIVTGEENNRYNILCDNRFEDFDIIRVGVEVIAQTPEAFKQGLENIRLSEIPFRVIGMPISG